MTFRAGPPAVSHRPQLCGPIRGSSCCANPSSLYNRHLGQQLASSVQVPVLESSSIKSSYDREHLLARYFARLTQSAQDILCTMKFDALLLVLSCLAVPPPVLSLPAAGPRSGLVVERDAAPMPSPTTDERPSSVSESKIGFFGTLVPGPCAPGCGTPRFGQCNCAH